MDCLTREEAIKMISLEAVEAVDKILNHNHLSTASIDLKEVEPERPFQYLTVYSNQVEVDELDLDEFDIDDLVDGYWVTENSYVVT